MLVGRNLQVFDHETLTLTFGQPPVGSSPSNLFYRHLFKLLMIDRRSEFEGDRKDDGENPKGKKEIWESREMS